MMSNTWVEPGDYTWGGSNFIVQNNVPLSFLMF